MSSVWKIGTTSQAYADASTFAAAKLVNLRRHVAASGQSDVTFEAPAALALTADSSFVYGTSYIVWKDGVRWFYGRCTTLPRSGGPTHETTRVVLADPYWYFRECTYQQSWKVYSIAGGELQNVNKSRVVLFQNAAGARCTTGKQVEDVIDWLIARGAPIAKGTIDAGITLPYDERTNLKCADVVDAVLRWTPDYVLWFDYTTVTPTVHFRARANLTAASLAITGEDLAPIEITPRYDLQKPGVHLTYEKTHAVDDLNYNTVETDTAGNVSAIDCVYGCFDLQGSARTYYKQKIVTADYPAANDKAWWKAQCPHLEAIADADLTIHDHAADAAISTYERYLVEGQIQDWMSKDGIEGCIRAQADYVIKDGDGNVLETVTDEEIAVRVVATDAATHTYTRLATFDSGEATPTGVAAALYSAWSILHFQGQLELAADECAGTFLPGKTLSLSGGRTEWTAMAALIQDVTEDVDMGLTRISFGPPSVLEADSLVALFRALRSRRFSWQYSCRTSGSATGSGDVEISGKTPSRPPSAGAGHKTIPVSELTDVTVDPDTIADGDALKWNAGTSKWVPGAVASSGGNNHSWKFTQTGSTGGDLTAGNVSIGGVPKTVTDLPASFSGITTSIKYWLRIEVAAATVNWESGATWPTPDSDTVYKRVLEITCSGGVIASVVQRLSSDYDLELIP